MGIVMSITRNEYGTSKNGEKVYCYTLDNGKGLSAEILTYGGIIKNLYTLDRNGNKIDVVLGRNTMEDYSNNRGYLGALIGRHANRIAGAKFDIDGREYTVGANEKGNSLHGGHEGFDKRVWKSEEAGTEEEPSLTLTLTSPDGDEGFPGNLTVKVTYTVTKGNSLRIEYNALSDADTVVNLTNHSYFNLDGCGTIDNQKLQINASFYTPNNEECMPTGEILSVAGTPFDFREEKTIGEGFSDNHPQISLFGGYDHNFVIDGSGYRCAAFARSEKTGIKMKVMTTESGMQLYTANALSEGEYKNGSHCGVHSAFCLETQCFPNAMKHRHFPSPVLRAGEEYKSVTEFIFGVR